MSIRLLEIHLEVADLERSRAFYAAWLPHERIVEWHDRSAVAFVLTDGTAFGLWATGKTGLYGGRGGSHVHYALQTDPADYDAMRQQLVNLGVEVTNHTWPGGHRSLYFMDPDGHQGELMTTDWLGLFPTSD